MKKIIYFIICLITALSLMPISACSVTGVSTETGESSRESHEKESITPKEKAEYPYYEREVRPMREKTEIEDFDMFSSSCVKWLGRNKTSEYYGENAVALLNVASGFSVSFSGSSLTVRLYAGRGALGLFNSYIKVYTDGEEKKVLLNKNEVYFDLEVAKDLDENEIHTVKVLKVLEEDFSRLYISGISTDGAFYTPDEDSDLKIDFYGDSITAGFGVLGSGGETTIDTAYMDGTVTYAAKIADYLSADYNVFCKQGLSLSSSCDANNVGFYMKDIYKNYSVYDGEEWDYSKYQPNVIVINLGTNDYNALIDPITGKFNPTYATNSKLTTFVSEYTQMIEGLHEKCPDAKIICCLGMMGASSLYEKIAAMVKRLNGGGADYLYCAELYLGKLGAYGHPSVQSNEVNSEIILELMSAYMGINKIYNKI